MRLNEPANDQLASLLPVTERGQRFWGHLLDDMTQEVVNVVRLDDVWDELIGGVRTIVKIDTQGFDQQVLEGSRGVLDRIAAIQTELSFSKYYEGATTYLDELAWLREHGFMPVALRTVTSDEGGVIAEADCLLRRPRRT